MNNLRIEQNKTEKLKSENLDLRKIRKKSVEILSICASSRVERMPELTSASALEAYVLLANGAKGAAAVGLIQQVLESQTVYVFGELLDHPNIKDLESNSTIPNGQGHFQLLSIFAYGLYADYEANKAKLPKITENMRKKLRLLTVASMANKEKTIQYDQLKTALGIESIRELEDLIIEGTSNDVIRGKLDQKSSHFEVDYAMGRDIRKVKTE